MKLKILLLILLFSMNCIAQKNGRIAENIKNPNISNLILGTDDIIIITKYGQPKIEKNTNKTKTIVYDNIILDNNVHIKNVFFTFFKKKLFRVTFNCDVIIDSGLTAKYGYKQLSKSLGVYGDFFDNIKLLRSNDIESDMILLFDDNIAKLSESEGF